jgi:hypothetical protein
LFVLVWLTDKRDRVKRQLPVPLGQHDEPVEPLNRLLWFNGSLLVHEFGALGASETMDSWS